MGVNIGKLNQPQLYNYEYDQLNRLVSMQAYRGFSGNSWSGITATTDHQESITYDGNGNIVSYLRNVSQRLSHVPVREFLPELRQELIHVSSVVEV
jgi:hypothetical protein